MDSLPLRNSPFFDEKIVFEPPLMAGSSRELERGHGNYGIQIYRWFSSWESDDYLTWGFKMLILTSAWSCDILQPTNMVFQMRLTTKNPPCGEVKKQLYTYIIYIYICSISSILVPAMFIPGFWSNHWQSYPAPQKHILRQARGMIGAALTEAWESGSAKRDVKMGTDS